MSETTEDQHVFVVNAVFAYTDGERGIVGVFATADAAEIFMRRYQRKNPHDSVSCRRWAVLG